jgi:hypothetical protein
VLVPVQGKHRLIQLDHIVAPATAPSMVLIRVLRVVWSFTIRVAFLFRGFLSHTTLFLFTPFALYSLLM